MPGTGMETAQQMSFCKTGGVAGAAKSWGGGSGRSTQRTCWRESPRQCRREGAVTSLSGSSWPGGRQGQLPGLMDGGRNRAPRMWQGGRWLVPSD